NDSILSQSMYRHYMSFLRFLSEKFRDRKYPVLNYIPDAVPLILQSLFYAGNACLVDGEHCSICPDYYFPDAYFQEVKPISVETLAPGERRSRETFPEDSTKLASMLVPYKPFFRYFPDNDYMGIVHTEHREAWVDQLTSPRQVKMRLRSEGIHTPDGFI